MLILLPVFLLLFTALALLALRYALPGLKYTWLIAAGGALLALVGVFIWQVGLPHILTLPAWQPETLFTYSPVWRADALAWPYALSLTALAAAVILTSVVRAEINPLHWAGTLLMAASGLLAVTAGNPLTLAITWVVIDLAELVTMLLSIEGESPNESVVIAFSARLVGIGLVVWASVISMAGGVPLDFQTIPSQAGMYLLLAVGLRLGVLPLHLPYQQEPALRRGFGTMLRLVSVASSLALLAHIPSSALSEPLIPYLLALVALAALYTGWMWLRAPDELAGRPFWLICLASLSIAATLRGNATGSIAWGIILLLSGGLLFLYSARQRALTFLVLTGLWGLAALPFSAGASGWISTISAYFIFRFIFLPAQALLIAGYIRHALHIGESTLAGRPNWEKFFYSLGLALLSAMLILLGLWGWNGAQEIGEWWIPAIVIPLSAALVWLARRLHTRAPAAKQRDGIFHPTWLYRLLGIFYRFLGRISDVLSNTFEGNGGVLWSLLLLVLIASLLVQAVH